MAYPPRRYVRVPKGVLDIDGISKGASGRELLAMLWQSPSTRRIPGVLRAGPAQLAEECGVKLPQMRRALQELAEHGLIGYDDLTRTIRVRGAIETDPPANPGVLMSWASDLNELPPSHVRAEIQGVIAATIAKPEQQAEWYRLTATASSPADTVSDTVYQTVSQTVLHTPVPLPVPSPVPTPPPQPPPSADGPLPAVLEPYLAAAERLGEPFEFAEAAARLSPESLKRLTAIPLEEWADVLEALAQSFFVTNRAKCPPTLPRLINNPKLRAQLREGEFVETGRARSCAICGVVHSFLLDCPPLCPGCNRRHDPDSYCGSASSKRRSHGARWSGDDGHSCRREAR